MQYGTYGNLKLITWKWLQFRKKGDPDSYQSLCYWVLTSDIYCTRGQSLDFTSQPDISNLWNIVSHWPTQTRKCQSSQIPMRGCRPTSSLTPLTRTEVPGHDRPGHLGGNLDRWCKVTVLCLPVVEVAEAQEGCHTGEEVCEADFSLWEAPVILMTFPLRKAHQKNLQ